MNANADADSGLHDPRLPGLRRHRVGRRDPLEQTEQSRWGWTVSYYAIVVVFGVAVHQQFATGLLGVPASTWLWKANEVYVLAVAIPLYWEFVATRRGQPVESPLRRRVAWYAMLVIILACLEGPLIETITGSRLPQRVITLRDVIVGLVAVALYFDWSRGVWRRDGPRMASWWARASFFVVALLVNVAIFQQPVRDALGEDNFGTLDFHAEAFATLFFIPVYFDVVLPLTGGDDIHAVPGPWRSRRRWVVLAVWVAVLTFFVWIGQGAARSWFDNSFGQWFVRSPEPPLAAIVFTLYFEIVRRLDGIGPAGSTPRVERSGTDSLVATNSSRG